MKDETDKPPVPPAPWWAEMSRDLALEAALGIQTLVFLVVLLVGTDLGWIPSTLTIPVYIGAMVLYFLVTIPFVGMVEMLWVRMVRNKLSIEQVWDLADRTSNPIVRWLSRLNDPHERKMLERIYRDSRKFPVREKTDGNNHTNFSK